MNNTSSDSTGKGFRGQVAAWLTYLVFLALLYWMGVAHWHALRFFVFLLALGLLCLALVLAIGRLSKE